MQTNPFLYLWLAIGAFLLALVGLVLALTASDPSRRKLFWWATVGSALGAVVLVVIYIVSLFNAVRNSFDYIDKEALRYELPKEYHQGLEEEKNREDSLRSQFDSLRTITL